MGCKFDPNDFKKLKEEIDMKEEAKKSDDDSAKKPEEEEDKKNEVALEKPSAAKKSDDDDAPKSTFDKTKVLGKIAEIEKQINMIMGLLPKIKDVA